MFVVLFACSTRILLLVLDLRGPHVQLNISQAERIWEPCDPHDFHSNLGWVSAYNCYLDFRDGNFCTDQECLFYQQCKYNIRSQDRAELRHLIHIKQNDCMV